MNKQILVTGAKGLIGSEICKLLAGKNFEVIAVDREFERSHPGCIDTRDGDSMRSLVQTCDGIIHLAAISRVVWGELDPKQCWEVNVEATKNIVEAALESPFRPWLLFASSREVYGQQLTLPVIEEAPFSPMNTYAKSKVVGEMIIEEAKKRGLAASIVRFSNVFGCAQDHADRVIPAFCRAALENGCLRIDGSKHTFDFTYYKDVAEGVMRIVQKLNQGNLKIPTIHFTSGRGIMLSEAAAIICRLANSSARLEEGTPRSFDVTSFIGDNARAHEFLAWRPKISFEEGVLSLLRSLREELLV